MFECEPPIGHGVHAALFVIQWIHSMSEQMGSLNLDVSRTRNEDFLKHFKQPYTNEENH